MRIAASTLSGYEKNDSIEAAKDLKKTVTYQTPQDAEPQRKMLGPSSDAYRGGPICSNRMPTE
jgi:hypothetical protein